MYLFFDTETNGLPKNWQAPANDLGNWPRVIQLAWVLVDSEMNEIDSFCQLIFPDGWEIPTEDFWTEHGYSTATNKERGVRMDNALIHFARAIDKCQYMVAHNTAFDVPVLGAEMMRYGIKAQNRPTKVCTMKASTNFCALPGKRGFKWPKLEELHEILFGHKFEGAHDALEDVRATVRCFGELVKLGVIRLN